MGHFSMAKRVKVPGGICGAELPGLKRGDFRHLCRATLSTTLLTDALALRLNGWLSIKFAAHLCESLERFALMFLRLFQVNRKRRDYDDHSDFKVTC